MPFCTQCGSEMGQANYCPKCGIPATNPEIRSDSPDTVTMVTVPNSKPKGHTLILIAGIALCLFAVLNFLGPLLFSAPIFIGTALPNIHIDMILYTPICLLALISTIMAIALSRNVKKAKLLLVVSIITCGVLVLLVLGFLPLFSFRYGSTFVGLLLISSICAFLVFLGAKQNRQSPLTVEVPNTHPLAYKHGVGAPRATVPVAVGQVGADGKIYMSATTALGDAPNIGFAVLGFLVPLVGLILFLVWKGQYPLKAKSCGKGALIGTIVGVAVPLIALGVFAIISAVL